MSYLRMAGQAMKGLKGFLSPGPMSNIDKVMRFGPDIGFGALAAAQTPGDLGDKAIAFGSAAGGGLLGGLGSAGFVRKFGQGKMDPQSLQAAMGAADMFGSIGGDMIAMPIGDTVARGKDLVMGGRGETAFERLGADQQEAMRKEMEQSILAQYGMVPGGRYDDYLRNLGMS